MNAPFFKSKLFIIVLLVVLTVLAYLPTFNNGFTNYDDPAYVTKNLQVQSGISLRTIGWAFASTIESNWHPLTWISHAIDYSLFGLNPAYHHGMNLLLHILSTIILFLVMERMTKKIWPSAFVAVVFALHPLHVESVAWIAERKDVLSGLFFMMTIGAYVYYCEAPNIRRYTLTALIFALGLLAKPMLITLPFVLVLLDYWPLRRMQLSFKETENKKKKSEISLAQSFKEKIPLFILSVLSSSITYIVQQKGGSMAGAEALSSSVRISNAIVSYLKYIWKSIYPSDLAVFYPHPEHTLPLIEVLFALGIIVFISFIIWKLRTSQPYLPVGWLWFLGTLIPVIGIVQVGLQSMADRYMYLPIIGMAIMVAWGIQSLIIRLRIHPAVSTTIAVFIIVFMAIGTHGQASVWKNSFSLYNHALSVTSGNHLAHTNLGIELSDSGNYVDALFHLRNAFQLRPNEIHIRSNLAYALVKNGQLEEALEHYRYILPRVQPSALLHRRMGDVLAGLGNTEEAIAHFTEAISLDTSDNYLRLEIADLYTHVGRFDEAQKQCRIVLAREPKNSRAHNILGIIAGRQQNYEEAIREFSDAVRLDSTNADAFRDFGILYERMEKQNEAMDMYKKAIQINPLQWKAHLNYGAMLAERKQYGEAEVHWKQAFDVNPKNEEARNNLVRLYRMQSRWEDARIVLSEALNYYPRDPSLYCQLGDVLFEEEEYDEAGNYYRAALEISPSYGPAEEGIQKVTNYFYQRAMR